MRSAVIAVYDCLHRYLIWYLVAAYAMGAVWPRLGLAVRYVRLATPWSGGPEVTLLRAMLAILLLNAGLGMGLKQLRQLRRGWMMLLAALGTGFAVPLLFVTALAAGLALLYPSGLFFRDVVVGMAVVAAMPAAGSSMAWSQNADGNLALSLGLVIFSTLLSPLTAVLTFHVVASVLPAGGAGALAPMASGAIVVFLTLWVIVPAALGVVVRAIARAKVIERAMPYIKLINLGCLLTLNYANAALSLPSLIAHPVPMRITAILLTTLGFALLTMASAGVVGNLFWASQSERASLYFGTGMRNNGAGLVLVSSTLPLPGPVLLPIIVYNLVQHFAAALIDRYVLIRNSLAV